MDLVHREKHVSVMRNQDGDDGDKKDYLSKNNLTIQCRDGRTADIRTNKISRSVTPIIKYLYHN